MKVKIFQSDKGDCLLITSGAGTHRILVDGGMASSYSEHVAPALAKLTSAKQDLDAVYVSHIDDDHIAGVLRLMDDLVAWRVYDFQSKQGNSHIKKPTSPRPPEIKKIWHNAFHDLLGANSGPISDMLAASTSVLGSSAKALSNGAFLEQSQLALSKRQALQLVQRVSAEQLDIPVNPEFKHKLMLVKPVSPKLQVGPMNFTMIGPFEQDLKILREEWNQWLRDSKEIVSEIRRKAKADEDLLTSDVDRLLAPLTNHSEVLLEAQMTFAKTLGRRAQVTTPNLASLMFLAEEGSDSVLLTGDGHADDALKGLERHEKFGADGKLHVNVLKVPHHGSEHNMTVEFAERITADHYVFCGNGFSTNPEVEVIDLLVAKRRKALPSRAFTLWFNSTSAISKYPEHMRVVEKAVAKHVKVGEGKVRAKWISGSSMEI